MQNGATIYSLSGYAFHFLRLGASVAVDNYELHSAAYFQGAEIMIANGAVVYKDIPTLVALYKTIAFFIIKPLDCAGFLFFHNSSTFPVPGLICRKRQT